MQEDINKKDYASKLRFQKNERAREAREKFKELKNKYKKDRRNNWSDSKYRREIKSNYLENVSKLREQLDSNKSNSLSKVEDDSIDKITRTDSNDFIDSIPNSSPVSPDGWIETNITICIDGEDTEALILVKNPE